MQFCLNPACPHPQNPEQIDYCQGCGSKLTESTKSYLFRMHYQVIKLLGEGGFGRTYLAKDTDDYEQRFCVIKKLIATTQGPNQAKIKELFAREAAQLHALNHPQIPKLYAYFEQEDSLYLVQEFVDGQSLSQEFEQKGVFDESQIKQVLKEILAILQYIQTQQILHRDIKPDNIMRRRQDGKLVLIDFGAARVKTGNDPTILTAIYTPGYSAPEHVNGRPTAASDIYSLGVTCIKLLTGCLSPDQNDLIYNAHSNSWCWQEYLEKKQIFIDSKLATILNKMTANSVQQRYENAQEVLRELLSRSTSLSNTMTQSPQTPSSFPSPYSSPPPPPAAPVWKVFAIIFMVLTGLTGLWSALLLQKNLQLESQIGQINQENTDLQQQTEELNKQLQQKAIKVRFHEDFDDNLRQWATGLTEDYNQYISDSKYYFQTTNQEKSTWVAWSYIDLPQLPANYNIELISIFVGEKNKYYGLWLGQDHDNFLMFEVNQEGSAQVRLNKNDEWQDQPLIPRSFTLDNSQIVRQVVEVRGNQFSYYVNGQLMSTGVINQFPIIKVGVSAEYTQTVAFDSITITIPGQ